MQQTLYHYSANVIAVYDGDTITVDIDLGLSIWAKGEKIRLNRINAPEMRGPEKPEGTLSRDFLRGLILNKQIILETIKDKKGKYGRYLGEIWLDTGGGNYINVNDEIVKNKFAVYHKY